MAQTNLQLFELNQRTISQWYSRRQKERERMVLQQGLGLAVAPSVTAQPLPEAKPLHYQREGIQAPFPFPTPPPPPRSHARPPSKESPPKRPFSQPTWSNNPPHFPAPPKPKDNIRAALHLLQCQGQRLGGGRGLRTTQSR
ncbi:homeobox protein prophet of Pit-1-like [Salmo salar]|uniref:Homeobox protein prophet of Pit-1-like n=1 Tax=Salmo salar TaxID=8030 RepID=A0ABM3CNA0_SALSA|nr:homeobox protein prophet of Pit-1-like [Salmo salar]